MSIASLAVALFISAASTVETGTVVIRVNNESGGPTAACFSLVDSKGNQVATGVFRGERTVSVPVGQYRLVAHRGPADTVHEAAIEVQPGSRVEQEVVLERVLDLSGLFAVDPFFAEGDPIRVEAEGLDAVLVNKLS